MRRFLCLVLVAALLLPCLSAMAEDVPGLSVSSTSETVRPGRSVLLTFTVPKAGMIDMRVLDVSGNEVSVVVLSFDARAGVNQVWWNGTFANVAAPAGQYRLVLTQDGSEAETPITIGGIAPYLSGVQAADQVMGPEKPMQISFYASCDGRITTGLRTGSQWRQIASWQVSAGNNSFTWSEEDASDGEAIFTLSLTDAEGTTSSEVQLPITLRGFDPVEMLIVDVTPTEEPKSTATEEPTPVMTEEPQPVITEEPQPEAAETEQPTVSVEQVVLGDPEPAVPETDDPMEPDDAVQVVEIADQSVFTPSYGSPYTGMDQTMNYWTLPMDITNTEAIWEMLMQPITVIDDGGKKNGEHRRQVVIREEPSDSSRGVGVVTNLTQSVHVLERGEEWSLIETYSSSFHDSAVKAWNMLVYGYVKTSLLKEITPYQGMGLVVDKLTQRLYIFKDGELYDTLLCSTGLSNAKQPYNETRSGEFLLQTPPVGGWQDGNMNVELAIRFNSGDILHQVPSLVGSDGTKDFATLTRVLGQKASHGCIRVQRQKTPKGTNMNWIYTNRADEMKIVIWEDWQGRQIAYPSDDMTLYYNPNGGKQYHTAETCFSASGKTFTPFTYGELENDGFAKLTRCTYCAPPLRKSEIDAINSKYAPGGDHDPILTEARRKEAEKQAK